MQFRNYRVERDGLTIDLIAWHLVKDDVEATEMILNTNRGLAALPLILPIGTVISLPEELFSGPKPKTQPLLRLYD
jgi:phage tail protein X